MMADGGAPSRSSSVYLRARRQRQNAAPVQAFGSALAISIVASISLTLL